MTTFPEIILQEIVNKGRLYEHELCTDQRVNTKPGGASNHQSQKALAMLKTPRLIIYAIQKPRVHTKRSDLVLFLPAGFLSSNLSESDANVMTFHIVWILKDSCNHVRKVGLMINLAPVIYR